jgi:hypothetical protein
MAGEAGDGTTKEVGIAQKLGKEGHHVTRDTCRQRRVIVWDAFSTGFILHASVHEVQHSV